MNFRRRSPGVALPMVLVVLLLGAFLVYVTFEIVGDLFVSSQHVVKDVELYNAAADGIEKGKVWILKARSEDGRLPDWGKDTLEAADLGGSDEDYYKVLIVENDTPESADFLVLHGNISVNVKIYDMDYDPGTDLDKNNYRAGFPPRLIYDAGEAEGMSARMGPTYVTSNRGEGTTGSGYESVELGYYLIRSTASFEDKEKIIEEAVIIRL